MPPFDQPINIGFRDGRLSKDLTPKGVKNFWAAIIREDFSGQAEEQSALAQIWSELWIPAI